MCVCLCVCGLKQETSKNLDTSYENPYQFHTSTVSLNFVYMYSVIIHKARHTLLYNYVSKFTALQMRYSFRILCVTGLHYLEYIKRESLDTDKVIVHNFMVFISLH